MNKSRVVLIRCDGYDENPVHEAVSRGITLLGGITSFIKAGEKIVLKPNVLFGMDPQKCVTTHPSVFKAVGRICLEAGAILTYGDSPGFGQTEMHMRNSGLKQVADDLGIQYADFDSGRNVTHEKALLNKRFYLARGALEADGMISLPKFKTHGMMRYTGAVKNQFGCIPGINKAQFHLKMQDPYDFARMLVDINTFLKPRLYVMDGIHAMEGNGPRNGKPRELNLIMLSSDPIALDAIACKIVDFTPAMLATSRPGEEAGLGTYHEDRIDVLGDEIGSFITRDFDIVRKPPDSVTSSGIRAFIKNQTCPRPVINKAICTLCETCIEVCPADPKAIEMDASGKSKYPCYRYDRCIRCYCCQELCPEGAITIREPFLGKLLFR